MSSKRLIVIIAGAAAVLGSWGLVLITNYPYPQLGHLFGLSLIGAAGLGMGATVGGAYYGARRKVKT